MPNLRYHIAALFVALLVTKLGTLHARTFTDRSGKTVDAEIVTVAPATSTVRLRATTGAEFDVLLANLSDADQLFVREWAPPPKPGMEPLGAPGETITIEFPELPKDRRGEPAACKVRLPTQYDPAKPMPLLLWIAGGDGSNNPGDGLNLVDGATYAVAAMPYPDTAPTPKFAIAEGKFDTIRNYHMAMLTKLAAKLPNVHPKLRFAGGFSNGAHTVGTYVADAEKQFVEYFKGFIIIEGGAYKTEARKKLRDHYAYMAWGDIGDGSAGFMTGMASCLKDARIETTTRVMTGVGHAFPGNEKAEVKKWIETVATPGLLGKKP